MDHVRLGLVRSHVKLWAIGLLGALAILIQLDGASSKDRMVWVKVLSSDNKIVVATIQAPIDKTWQDVADTDPNGEKKFAFDCPTGGKLRAKPVEKAKYTMSEEALCFENIEIVLRVQPVDQELTAFSMQIDAQMKGSKDAMAFGWLPANAEKALSASNYALTAQTYWQIRNVASSKDIAGIDRTRLTYFATQAMAAHFGLNPKETVLLVDGKIKYLDPKFSEKIKLIQESAGLYVTGVLDTNTLAAFTGVDAIRLQENPLVASHEIPLSTCNSGPGCPFSWNQPAL
jgi:hypothetical protein